MTKTLDIVMAGVISGLVAYTTTQLGIGGTVIGAVLGSMGPEGQAIVKAEKVVPASS